DGVLQISINGNEVDLSHISQESLSDWSYGFLLNVEPYVNSGSNTIQITFWDQGDYGLMGMKIQPEYSDWRMLIIWGLGLVLVFAVIMMLRPALKIPRRHLALYFLIALGA